MAQRKKIAAILTAFFPAAHGSHADLVVSKFARGFPTTEGLIDPKVDLVSMYIDQPHWTNLGPELAQEYGIEIFESIRGALTMKPQQRPGHWTPDNEARAGELAVDGVMIVAEHGDYASNEQQRHLYPRRHFFEQVCGVFATSGRSVPVFNDKHLSYNWDDSLWMYKRAQELDIPFMAGSALPLCSRGPELEHEIGTPIDEALSIGYIHPFLYGIDSYGFHSLEGLQCMVERRNGGETGIRSVQCLEGADVWTAGKEGVWSQPLALAAETRIEALPPMRAYGAGDGLTDSPVPLKEPGRMEDNCRNPIVFILEYNDGLRASTLLLPGHLRANGYAARVDGEILSTGFIRTGNQDEPFSYQAMNIQQMFTTGQPQYPVERTLLVSGALDALMESKHKGHVRVETPHLDVTYKPLATDPIRIR